MTQERLPHGYTNATRHDHGVVTKRYLGPDALIRQHAEVTALRHLASALPVPALIHDDVGQIGTAPMPGRPGQELLELDPDAVLASVGRTAALLHGINTTALATPEALGPAEPGTVLVHGDFGPQNLLLDPDTFEASAIVDWEFAHLGDGVLDLAWAEWIVRIHHPHLVDALPNLFQGYGAEPTWGRRQAAMVAKCEWALDFVTRWAPDNEAARVQWRERLEVTISFTP